MKLMKIDSGVRSGGPYARAALACLLLAALPACSQDDADGGADPARAASAPLAIEPVPLVSVGVLEGDPMQEFDRVQTAFLMPAGELAVATLHEIRIFDTDGAFVRSLGGQGAGPGEFAQIASAWARGDTIEVWDDRARRITRFPPGGEVETVSLAGVTEPLDQGVGPLGEGWALTRIDLGEGRDDMAAVLVARDGTHLRTLAALGGMARFTTPEQSGPHPVTPTALYRVHENELYAAETLTPAISVYAPPDTTSREIALPLEAPGPPAVVFQEVIDAAAADEADSESAAALQSMLSLFSEPDEISSFWAFLVDGEGFVWVRPYDPMVHALVLGGRPAGQPGPGGEWVVVARDGSPAGRITVPPGLEPLQVTGDAVVGIHRDELGVESVRVHRLRRNP